MEKSPPNFTRRMQLIFFFIVEGILVFLYTKICKDIFPLNYDEIQF